jgi:hypothetical protein
VAKEGRSQLFVTAELFASTGEEQRLVAIAAAVLTKL